MVRINVCVRDGAIRNSGATTFRASHAGLANFSQCAEVGPRAYDSHRPLPFGTVSDWGTSGNFFRPISVLLRSRLPNVRVRSQVSNGLSKAIVHSVPSPISVMGESAPLRGLFFQSR